MLYVFDKNKFIGKYDNIFEVPYTTNYAWIYEQIFEDTYSWWSINKIGIGAVVDSEEQAPKIYRALLLLHKD